MKHDASEHDVAGLTWDRIGQQLRNGAAAILPIGVVRMAASTGAMVRQIETDGYECSYVAQGLPVGPEDASLQAWLYKGQR